MRRLYSDRLESSFLDVAPRALSSVLAGVCDQELEARSLVPGFEYLTGLPEGVREVAGHDMNCRGYTRENTVKHAKTLEVG